MALNNFCLVCGGTGCESSKADEIFKNLKKSAEAHGIQNEVQIVKTGCTVSRASFAGIMRPGGTPANDLNDLTSRLPGSHEPYRFLFT